MAQQVEHVLGKDGVTGSNPVSSSKNTRMGVFCYIFRFLHNVETTKKLGNIFATLGNMKKGRFQTVFDHF